MSGADTESRAGPAGYEQVLKKADQSVASFEEDAETPLRRLQHFLHAHPTAIPAFVLVLAIILFSFIAGSKFLHPFNFSLVLQQVTIIGIVGVAQTLIVLTAGIDLSVGAMMVLSSVVMGKFAIDVGLPVPFAFASGLVVGTLCGIVNGLLVTKLRLPPFIVTLGTWSIFFALNLWYSGSESIRSQDIAATAGFLQFTGTPFCHRPGTHHHRLDPDAGAGGAVLVHPQLDLVRPARLCDRRRSGSSQARRHPHRRAAALGLCDRRLHLRASPAGRSSAASARSARNPATPRTSIPSPPW